MERKIVPVLNLHAMKTYGEKRYRFTHSCHRHYKIVGDQLHVPAYFLPRKGHPEPTTLETVWAQGPGRN